MIMDLIRSILQKSLGVLGYPLRVSVQIPNCPSAHVFRDHTVHSTLGHLSALRKLLHHSPTVFTVYLRAIFVFVSIFFFFAFIFFDFLLLPSKLSGIVNPLLEVASTLQDQPNFIQGSQTSFKGSSQSYQISRFHQASILSLRGGVKDILAH